MGILLNQKMGKKVSRKEKIEIFKKEVKRCLLLDKQDRKYWVDAADTLSEKELDDLIKVVSEKNKKMDHYITLALMNDEDGKILKELKQTIKETKKNIVSSKEEEEKVEAEEELIEKLKKI